jgi:hypothetical protein
MKKLPWLVIVAALAGCANKPSAKPAPQAKPTFFNAAPAVGPRDAVPDPQLVVSLTVYQLSVPARSVSRNEEFWKHANEDGIVDVGTHDLLFANGVRVGVAPRPEWEYFKHILEANSVVTQQSGATGGSMGTALELPLKKDVLQQYLMWFHPTSGLIGQVYDRCDNSMVIHFMPVPKRLGTVRVTVTPKLLAERTELMYTVRNEIQELNFRRPEYLFDMRLSVDVPLDNFLIVAPSADAEAQTSIGNRFLNHERNGEEYETVLLISPQPFRFEEKKAGPTTAAAAGNAR